MKPNYESYSKEQLLDVFYNIDREMWPDRFSEVKEHLKRHNVFINKHGEIEGIDSDSATTKGSLDFSGAKEKSITLVIGIILFFAIYKRELYLGEKENFRELDEPYMFYIFTAIYTAIFIWRVLCHIDA